MASLNPQAIGSPEVRTILGRGSGFGNGPSSGGRGPLRSDDEFMRELEKEMAAPPPDLPKVVAWFVLLIVLMTFGALFGAYIVISTNNVLEWRPFALPSPLWVSTFLIAASSITYYHANNLLRNGRQTDARRFFVITASLGGMFIGSQLVSWMTLYMAGFYVYGNPYAGFVYILTGFHALHVIGGIAALGSILLRSWRPTVSEEEADYRIKLSRSVGWYWHFMGLLWFILFALLGFWK